MGDWSRALEIAGTQYGAISAQQLSSAGVTPGVQRRAYGDGRLRRLWRGVYAVAGTPPSWPQQLHAGLLALGPAAWVSHEAAAAVHQLDRCRDGAVEFAVARGHGNCQLADVVVHETRDVLAADVVSVDGLRCSSATRAVIELANAGVGPTRLGAMIDSSVRLRLSSAAVLEARLASHRVRGRAGVRLLDDLVLDGGGESILERRFLRLVRTAGLPRPQTQRVLLADGSFVGRVDFLYPDEHLVVEVSGRLGHSTPTDRARDAQRRNELQDLGFTVIEYVADDVVRRPVFVVTSLRRRLTAAAKKRSATG